MNKQTQFVQACEDGDLQTVKALIDDLDVDPSYDDNDAICFAADYGHKEVVELLMQDSRVDPSDNYNVAIRIATQSGHKDTVDLFLTDKRVMDKIDDALEWCKEWDGYELLKVCVDERERTLKQQEKERRVQEAIEEMSADCELYF